MTIADYTRDQLAGLEIAPTRPLVICDVDDVVVYFLRAFEARLDREGLRFDAISFALHGNNKDKATNRIIEPETIATLIDDFFVSETQHLEAIDGAVAALLQLARQSTVVMLTNLPHHARDKRIQNLRNHGLEFPVITNAGPKGPAIRHLAAQTTGPVVFVDDSPNFIQSARDYAPHVHLVHFLHDQRFAKVIDPFDYVSLNSNSWPEMQAHIETLVTS